MRAAVHQVPLTHDDMPLVVLLNGEPLPCELTMTLGRCALVLAVGEVVGAQVLDEVEVGDE